MHERASSYVERGSDGGGRDAQPPGGVGENTGGNRAAYAPQPAQRRDDAWEESGEGTGQDSTFILLIILILLSQGKTDDKLLLALLYLLF